MEKKRHNKRIEANEYEQIQKHLKNENSLKNIQSLSINIDKSENISIENEENKEFSRLFIYEKPKLLIQLFDSQTIDLDLINDSLYFENKVEELNKFSYQIYTIENDNNKLRFSKKFNILNSSIKSITFEKENIYPYFLIMNSQIPEITETDLLYKNIYNSLEVENGLISPKNISKLFFYYFRIKKQLQNNYFYIESDNRIKLYDILSSYFCYPSNNIIIIVGPKGIGKTTSIITFSFQPLFRIFYFNLEAFKINHKDIKKKELKIQLYKLLGSMGQNSEQKEKDEGKEEKNEGKKEEKDIKNLIEDYIDNNIDENGFEFIYNIINLFKNFSKTVVGYKFGFIIDQFSMNYKINNKKFNIKNIINLANESKNNIKLILCPTINNKFSKEQIDTIFNQCLETSKEYFDIYYFQEVISKDEFLENIVEKQNIEYKNIIDEFGYSPKYFYETNNTNFSFYKNYLLNNLKDNIKEYYLNENNNDETKMNINILNLLDIVKCEKLISSSEFREHITNLPLKYLKIIKYKINDEIIKKISDKFKEYNKINKDTKGKEEGDILIKYLKLLWNNETNNIYDNIIEQNFFIDERDIDGFINNYIEKDKNILNIYGNYYKSFIAKYNNYFDNTKHEYESIYVYKLEFSLNLFENILLETLYEHIKNESLFFSKILDNGAFGGIFELLLGFFIQKTQVFLGEKIEETIYISSLVPYNYSILYYSSYNKEINKFKEFKLENNTKKEKYLSKILLSSK